MSRGFTKRLSFLPQCYRSPGENPNYKLNAVSFRRQKILRNQMYHDAISQCKLYILKYTRNESMA